MATASGAQREPSMEEILASIRRIIEDSDTGRKPADDIAEPAQQFEAANSEAPAREIEAFRAELKNDPVVAAKPSLAEIQSQLRAESHSTSFARHSSRTEPQTREAPTLAEIGAQVAKEASHAAPERAAEPSFENWAHEIASIELDDDAQTAPMPAERQAEKPEASGSIPASERTSSAAAEAHSDEKPIAEDGFGRPALVSEHTSRQVAASFGELSEAFASRSKKTFDDMAEEMLRPMLQDWLDNNLPTLVERLVREEIERVARGS